MADGDSDFPNGAEVVSRIREVFSVDLVTYPATASGWYESTESSPYAGVKLGSRHMADNRPTNPLHVIDLHVDDSIIRAPHDITLA